MNGGVYAIAVNGSDVYVGGYFTTAGGATANGIAKWDGNAWSALGSGVTPVFSTGVEDLAVGNNGELYFAGTFNRAGLKPASFFAIWHPSAPRSFPVGIAVFSGGKVFLNWPSEATGVYQILSTTNLSQPFTPLGQILSGGTNTSYTNAAVLGSAEFFRIQQVQP